MFSIRRSIETLARLRTTCVVLLITSLAPYWVALWFRMAVAANPEKFVFREESVVPVQILALILGAISALAIVGFLRQSRQAWNALPALVIAHLALVTWIFASEISQESGLGFCHVLAPRLGEIAKLLVGTQLFFVSAVVLTKQADARPLERQRL